MKRGEDMNIEDAMKYVANPLWGMELVSSKLALDPAEVQARKHKARRINKKWLKIYGYKTVMIPSTKVIVVGSKIIGHPKVIALIKANMKGAIYGPMRRKDFVEALNKYGLERASI